MLGKAWTVIEKGSTILGFVSGIVWVWALVYPGKAVEVLEDYQARFSAAEESLARIEETGQATAETAARIEEQTTALGDTAQQTQGIVEETKRDTERLVRALPEGITLSEVYRTEWGCSQTVHPDDGTDIIIENNEADLLENAFVTVLGSDGETLFEERETFFNAESGFSTKLKGRSEPARICIGAASENGDLFVAEYRVVGWRLTSDNCADNPNYGVRMFQSGIQRVPPDDMTFCE